MVASPLVAPASVSGAPVSVLVAILVPVVAGAAVCAGVSVVIFRRRLCVGTKSGRTKHLASPSSDSPTILGLVTESPRTPTVRGLGGPVPVMVSTSTGSPPLGRLERGNCCEGGGSTGGGSASTRFTPSPPESTDKPTLRGPVGGSPLAGASGASSSAGSGNGGDGKGADSGTGTGTGSSTAASTDSSAASHGLLSWADVVLHEPIGFGGQGHVHRAKWKGATVAVKTLKGLRGGEALLAEAAALLELHHPHVVRVFGYCSSPELAVVMEYVAWGCLSSWVTANKTKHDADTIVRRIVIARGIVSGMTFIHDNGFIHCDLKPGNVLLAFDGMQHSAKISDMGLAIRAPRLPPAAGAPRWGTVRLRTRGTPGYMAPELYAPTTPSGEVTVSQQVDVYSFGVLLASLFVGEVNWGEVLPLEPLQRAARQRELSLSGASPTVPPGTQVCVCVCGVCVCLWEGVDVGRGMGVGGECMWGSGLVPVFRGFRGCRHTRCCNCPTVVMVAAIVGRAACEAVHLQRPWLSAVLHCHRVYHQWRRAKWCAGLHHIAVVGVVVVDAQW